MAEISWIKLSTDIPDNRKVKRIRKLPDGDKIILFWVFLLSRAGESNKSGGLFITDTLPYSMEDLSADFDFSIEFVQFAILTLEKYSMITRYDEVLFIKNWEEYQSIEGMDKVREQNRKRQAIYREKQKQLTLSNVTPNVTGDADVTVSNGTDIELELDIELDIDKDNKDMVDPKIESDYLSPKSQQFEDIWKLYPPSRRRNKKGCKTKFDKVVRCQADIELIRTDILRYINYTVLSSTPDSYIATTQTYFNQERWNDGNTYEVSTLPNSNRNSYKQPTRKETLPDWTNQENKETPVSEEEQDYFKKQLAEMRGRAVNHVDE